MEALCSKDINWLLEFKIINLNENNELEEKDKEPGSLTTNCFWCGKKFTSFFNPSNLCIICSRLFCNLCMEKQKLKICKNCFKLCREFSEMIDNNLIKTREKGKKPFIEMRETYFCRKIKDYQTLWEKYLDNKKNMFENQLFININNIYDLVIKALISYILSINFNDEKIVEEWKTIIYNLIKEAISNLRISSKLLNDSLDINNYIKIKLIEYKDNSLCKVIKGYILQTKKIFNNTIDNIDNPKILLLNNEIYNSESKNMKEFIEYYIKLFESKINIIKPDIIIIGDDFPREIIDFLINNNFPNVNIIYNVKSKVMKKLSRCFQTLILPSINLVGTKYNLGKCQKFYIKKFSDNKNDYDEENNKNNNSKDNTPKNIINKYQINKDLYIFDGCNKYLFNTIILSGNDIKKLKIIKKIMRKILLPSIWDLFLQKYIQYTFNMEINPIPENSEFEEDFIYKLYKEGQEILPLKMNSSIFNKKFNKKNAKILKRKFSTKNSNLDLDIKNLFYEGFDLSIIEKKEDFEIYSLISLTSSQKNKIDIKNNLNEEDEENISEKEIHNIVNKYCGDGEKINLVFFNDYDKPLGKFILNLGKKSKSFCPTCKLEYSMHTQYIYKERSVLKIWMISGNEYDLDKIINYLNKITNIDYSQILPYQGDIYSYKEIHNTDIYTYGYCKICKGIVTRLFKINNEVFNYSSTKFIKFMLENNFSRNQIRDFDFNISNLIINKNCHHFINKDISRIFVTKFGTWIFEYNNITKYYIIPMNLYINDSFINYNIFKKYQEESYSNSIHMLELIKKLLSIQEKFFNEALKEEKLYLFNDFITSMIYIIQAIQYFNDNFIIDVINKYLKDNNKNIKNSHVRLISFIKNIYMKLVKIKLLINRIENFRINIQVISDILNSKIPITLEENKILLNTLLNENELEFPSSEIDLEKDISFIKILDFINYCDEKHDFFSCEFINDDLTSYIANILSSNDYIRSMRLKNRLNLASIKVERNKNENINNNLISNNFLENSSIIEIKDKKREINNLLDNMLIFDISKHNFYYKGEKGTIFNDKIIKNILEKEINSQEKEEKTFYLTNDLYSILIKRKKGRKIPKIIDYETESAIDENDLKSIADESDLRSIRKNDDNNSNSKILLNEDELNLIENNNDIERISSNSSFESIYINENKNVTFTNINKNENEAMNYIKMAKQDFKKISYYYKDIEKQLSELNLLFKEQRNKLIENIKKQINNPNKKEKKKSTEFQEINENNKNEKYYTINEEKNEKIRDNNINNEIINEMKEEIDIKKNEIKNNDINENKEKNIIKEKEEKSCINKDESIPFFSKIPEFEKIAKIKSHIFFEEKLILEESNNIEIIVYYPKQFEALRIIYCATLENFLTSLSKSTEWAENTGGKSKASFFKTFDEKYILKNVSESEFSMFINNGLNYFKYISKFLFEKKPSVLAKILGAYKIKINNKNKEIKYHLILMENLYYGMMTKTIRTFNSPNSNLKVYDLKGSNINRYINKNMRKPGQVLLDTNFLVDFNKEPVNIDSDAYFNLKKALYNDAMYLKSLGVVDYSLLIIFDNKGNEEKKEELCHNVYYDYETNNFFTEKEKSHNFIKLGIIDYIRKYTWDKKMEFYSKSFIYGEKPTIVDPNVYSDRFYKTISNYFVGI